MLNWFFKDRPSYWMQWTVLAFLGVPVFGLLTWMCAVVFITVPALILMLMVVYYLASS
jgi:hypothetical protein